MRKANLLFSSLLALMYIMPADTLVKYNLFKADDIMYQLSGMILGIVSGTTRAGKV